MEESGKGGDKELSEALAVLMHRLLKPTQALMSQEREAWVSLADGARYAAISEDTMRQWISVGLKHARRGRIIRVRKSDIDAFLLEKGETINDGGAKEGTAVVAKAQALLRTLGA